MLLLLGTLCLAVQASGLVSHPRAAFPSQRAMPRCNSVSLREEAADHRLSAAFLAAGGASSLAWSACAVASLATYKPQRVVHNSIGVAGALSTLPLLWAGCSTPDCRHSGAAEAGRERRVVGPPRAQGWHQLIKRRSAREMVHRPPFRAFRSLRGRPSPAQARCRWRRGAAAARRCGGSSTVG